MLTFERFEYYMEKVIQYDNTVEEVFAYYSEDVIDRLSVASSGLIQLIEELMGDEDTGWIGYWLYELEQGEKYVEGSVTIDDVPVPLATLEDLYNLLKDNHDRRLN